jgi:hypothetical protein
MLDDYAQKNEAYVKKKKRFPSALSMQIWDSLRNSVQYVSYLRFDYCSSFTRSFKI